MHIFHFFTDPVLRAPTIASMLMSFSAAIVGVLVFVRKQSLLGETLAHAVYPGVTSAILLAGLFSLESILGFSLFLGAFISCFATIFAIDRMEKKLRVHPDSALCALLALVFGIGITMASIAQSCCTPLYLQMQTYLYGQAATMTDIHILIYGALAATILLFVVLLYNDLVMVAFDYGYARVSGVGGQIILYSLFFLIVVALIIGVRCVGVILMSAMLIAPATAARQFTNRLSTMFLLSGLFGMISGLLGVYLSLFLSEHIQAHYAVPTGPMIVLVAGTIALYALFFAPKRGLVIRYIRILAFRKVCARENLIKAIWRLTEGGKELLSFEKLKQYQGHSSFYLYLLLCQLSWQKMLEKREGCYYLTAAGIKKGAKIVRLHRLWEVYLVHSLGLHVRRVHKSAEEMEHILTPELEAKLMLLLDNPTQDPHDQPIPLYH